MRKMSARGSTCARFARMGLAAAVLVAAVVCGGVRVRVDAAPYRPYWWAAGHTWWMRFLAEADAAKVVDFARDPAARSAGFKMWIRMVEEPGSWFTVSMKPMKVESVVFLPGTRMVVTTRDGRVVESEGFFFWPDFLQTELYESRKGPVVVNMRSVYRGPTGFCPVGMVKFPAGSLRLGDVKSFEVVGAVEQSDDGEVK